MWRGRLLRGDGQRLRGGAALRGRQGRARFARGDGGPLQGRRPLPCTERTNRGGVDLATNGANSRRATEDTSAVATLETPGPGNKFSRPILESAGIPLVTASSGRQAMKRTLAAIESAGSSEVRDKVRETLEPS